MCRLVQVSDVVVENFRPGVMKRLGFDYESLRKLNSSVIMCSISAFGQDSPTQTGLLATWSSRQ